MPLHPEAQRALVATAYASIAQGLALGRPGITAVDRYATELRVPAATFVTLTALGRLRGCCGALEPDRPLALDVWHNAYASAFRDPRFPPLQRPEYAELEVEISVLGPLEPIAARNDVELLAALVRGRHGLLLACDGRRATFLPQVWDDLPDPAQFLAHLKRKAGWEPSFWSTGLSAWRYCVEHVTAPGLTPPALAAGSLAAGGQ
jgi:AmmeMemoRadiSam system protein A